MEKTRRAHRSIAWTWGAVAEELRWVRFVCIRRRFGCRIVNGVRQMGVDGGFGGFVPSAAALGGAAACRASIDGVCVGGRLQQGEGARAYSSISLHFPRFPFEAPRIPPRFPRSYRAFPRWIGWWRLGQAMAGAEFVAVERRNSRANGELFGGRNGLDWKTA
jgi:hypothetical protein